MRFKPKGKPKKGKSKPKSSIISRGITSLFGNKKKSSSDRDNKRKNAGGGSYGLDNYNGMIMEIYDANTTTPEGVNETIPVEKKESKDGESKLVSETLRLRNTAVLNLKLKEQIFKYEKNRLNKLRLGGEGTAGGGAGASSGVTPIIPGEDGGGAGLPGLFGNPLRRAPKRTPKNNPNQPKNRNKNKNKNKSRNKNKNRNRNKPRSSNKPVTRGKGGARPNPFRKFNPFKPKVTSGKPAVPPGLNNPFKGLGNPFKRFGPKPSITIGGANKIPKGLNNPFDIFRKGPNVTRSMPQIPRGLQSPLGGLGLPKIRNPFAGPKVTTGGATRPFGLGPGASPTVTGGAGTGPLGGIASKLKGIKVPPGLARAGGMARGLAGKALAPLLLLDGYFTAKEIVNPNANIITNIMDLSTGISNAFKQDPFNRSLTEPRGDFNTMEPNTPESNAWKLNDKGNRRILSQRQAADPKKYLEQKQSIIEKYPSTAGYYDNPIPKMKEGGITEDKPQLVIVGDGGEKEYIVPESKLSYFLGTSQAAKYLNYGVSPLVTAATDYAKAAGIKTYGIPEMQDLTNIQRDIGSPIKGIALIQTTFSDLGDTIFKYVTEGFMSIMEPVKKIIEFVKNIIPPGIKKAVKGFAGFMSNLFGGRPAAAATLPPSLRTNLNGNLNMNPNGVVGGSTNGKFGQIGSEGITGAGHAASDGEETGVDIELFGSEGKIGKKYGNQSEQGPYGGRGVEIAFPYELTYNEFVPGGRNKGARSITSQGSTNREVKGQGAGGFGHIGSYTFTDENGKRYEIMMGHGDKPFNQFKEGQKLPPGTVLGYQGATGSSDDAAGGLYDHISFHVNSMDGGDANKVIRQFTNALIGGKSKTATEQLRSSQQITPVKSPINKDTAVDQDPLDEIQADLPLMNLFTLPTPPPQDPLVIPLSTRLGQRLSSSNTPAWGNASLIGG